MPTTRKNIEKWSFSYYLLKFYVDFGFKFYFRTTVAGLEKLPTDKPLIFAPNHQNALMDALAVLTIKTWQPIFLARADIFEKKLINKILTFIKILPVYRMRDGYENLHKNDEIFNKTIDVIKNGNGLVILPEGNHGDKKRLRPLKKGVARIALQAEEACNGELNIMIVPVGLDYTNYIRIGSELHIRFGTPIGIKPYIRTYHENPAKAYNLLIKNLESGMRNEMIDIDDEKYYTVYNTILNIFTQEFIAKNQLPNTHPSIVDTEKHIIGKINAFKTKKSDDFLVLAADALEYNNQILKLNLNPKVFLSPITPKFGLLSVFLFLLVTLPFFLISVINVIMPVGITYLASKKIKDLQFVSSVRFGAGLLLIPIFHFIQLIVFAIITESLYATILYAVALPLSVYIFFRWKELSVSFAERLKVQYYLTFSRKKLKRLRELSVLIKKQMWDIEYLKKEAEYMSNSVDI
jgi:1-acyl-sn-glycerol-3-phosphate acyltransferase